MAHAYNSDAVIKEMISLEAPKASVYIPTHRAQPDNRQDPIVFKNQLKLLEEKMARLSPRREWVGMFEKMMALVDDVALWTDPAEGLAVLAAGDRVETFPLKYPEGPVFYLGDSFHLLPLYPLGGTVSDAYLADIGRDRFMMYRVRGEKTEQMSLPDVKDNFAELFNDIDEDANPREGSRGGPGGAFHGLGAVKQEDDKNRQKYFRYLDDAFGALHKKDGLPVILAGTVDSLREFRATAKGAFYLDEEIEKPLNAMKPNDIREKARQILQPLFEKRVSELRTYIANKRNENKEARDPMDIASFAEEGRIEALFLTGRLRENEQARLDKAVEQVLMNGGKVYADRDNALEVPGGRLALLRY
ncbi:MAG: hypothetical protein PHQ85_03210 [Eubacteriales bacterium]|jgi:hypothetical protein|nr:hypothetical protein [Eubacteriales bacterium]MDD4105221.1 hypothetical protein [Eubacteriales bacterium]MDD4710443.1 hypothetical protein [Eubacteriales bacterium]NLO16016.1 hypothetical protein [Clostridiales bacterium]